MKRALLLLGDIVLYYAALFTTLKLRYADALTRELIIEHLPAMTVILAVWLVIFYIHNLYSPSFGRDAIAATNTLFRALALGTVFAILYFYLSPQTRITPKTNLFIHLAIVTIFYLVWRRLMNRVFVRWARDRMVLIGESPALRKLGEYLRKNPQLGYDIVLTLDRSQLAHLPPLHTMLRDRHVETVVVDNDTYRHPQTTRRLVELIPHGIVVERLHTFYERVAHRIPLGIIDHLWFLENISEHRQRPFEITKRIADILFAVVTGAVFLVLFPIVALAIKLTSPGAVFFRQQRVGQGLRLFTILKFRTMHNNAERDGAQWAREDDPRVTPVGRFLRATHIDELPQWWNVLKGEMSIIGPRAERPEFHGTLTGSIPFYEERYLVRPGITGWAQINYHKGASAADARNKLEYDLYYIKNRSPALDLSIVLKTVDIFFTGRGSW